MLHTSMTMNKFFVNIDSLVNVSRKVSFQFPNSLAHYQVAG